MDDVLPGLDLALELTPELDEARQLARLDALLERRVEGAAERDVDGALAELDALGPDERRDVPEPHRAHATVLDVRPRVEPAGGHVDDDVVLTLLRARATPSSSAQVTSAIVPCPHAVE